MNKLTILQNKIKYNFENIELLKLALTHKSITKQSTKNNQRLEFLGDSILGAAISDYLYSKFPSYSDGELTILKSTLVRKETLASLGKKLLLNEFLVKSDRKTSEITTSMLEDTVESIIGAIFLDSDFYRTKKIIISLFEIFFMKEILSRKFLVEKQSFTAKLKEYSEKKFKRPPIILLIKKEGKDNSPIFIMEVKVGDITKTGKGHNKKEAISNASKKILEIIPNI